ncbi:HepT-like ribonuclease domain-containing protein [Mucilaginibacter sp.]
MLQQAVERNIEIIGEAVNALLKIDDNIKITDARRIVDTRNKIIHGYDSIQPEQIWNIIINHLPSLKTEVRMLLDN